MAKFDPSRIEENSGANLLFRNFGDNSVEKEETPGLIEVAKDKPKEEPVPLNETAAEAVEISAKNQANMAQINTRITPTLLWALEDKMLHTRRHLGVKVSKTDVVKDGIVLFAYGHDFKCPEGHRFIIADNNGDIDLPNIMKCPVCGAAVSAAMHKGCFMDRDNNQ